MYRIVVLDNNGEHDLDMIEPSFPFNFESNDVAQLNDSTASWSYSISLPRTANNERLLGNAGVPFVNSLTPYMKMECNVYADGLRIIHRGVLVIDTTTRTEYKVQILAGTANVFDLMKGISFATWNKTTVTLPATTQPSVTDPASGNSYAYYMPLFISTGNISTRQSTKEDDFYMYATPFLRVGNPTQAGTLKNLLDEIGYSLVTDTPDALLDKLWLTMIKRKKTTGGNSYMWRSAWSGTGTSNVITNEGKSRRGKTRFSCSFTSRNDFYNPYRHEFISLSNIFASFPGSVYLIFYDQNGNQLARVDKMQFSVSGNDLVASATVDGSAEYASFYTFGGASTETWRYYDGSNFIEFTNGLHITSYNWRVETLPAEETDNALAGQRMNLEANCGIANGMDFFKILSQVFGWTVKVDADTKTIYARTFDYIVGNKANAKDWTSRLDMAEDIEADFEFGKYAQENAIKLQENKLGGFTETGSFTIPNVNLKETTNLLDIKVTSGRSNRVEQWERKEIDEYQWKDGSAPHLLKWEDNTQGVTHIMPADILANYQPLIDTLQQVVLIKVKMILSAVDILNFDQFVPIYLRQYGRYFYVNKISNWESGKACDVELLQLTF